MLHHETAKSYKNFWNGSILHEAILREAARTSIDGYLYDSNDWFDAVATDGKYISDYARDNPSTEDIAETYLVWFATRYRPRDFTDSELT